MSARLAVLVALAGCGTPAPPPARSTVPAGSVAKEVSDAIGQADPPASLQCAATRPSNDCFVRVPGGTFARGAQATDPAAPGFDPDAAADEGPVQRTTVAPFWIGRVEATVAMFARCVTAGVCRADDVRTSGFATFTDADVSGRSDLPVNGITWDGARRLCGYFGARLPSEAEWEFAARGTDDRRYPWGSDPGCGVATEEALKHPTPGTDGMVRGTCPATGPSHPRALVGLSPFGAAGMAGNLWEWTDGAYPHGAGASSRVLRGGGWMSTDPVELRVTVRQPSAPDVRLPDVGVRCVWGSVATP